MSTKVFGAATIKVGGIALDSNKGASLDVGGEKRTSKMTAKRRAGHTSEQMPSKVECTIPMTPSTKLKVLHALTDVTISFKADTGQLYTIAHADCMDPPSADDQSGDVKLVFEGDEAQETGS